LTEIHISNFLCSSKVNMKISSLFYASLTVREYLACLKYIKDSYMLILTTK